MYGRIDVKELESQTLKKFNISNEGFNRILPIIILFEKDKEVLRFPPFEEKGTKKIKNDKKILRYNKVFCLVLFLIFINDFSYLESIREIFRA